MKTIITKQQRIEKKLDRLTKRFGKTYIQAHAFVKRQSKEQQEYFDALTSLIQLGTLGQQLVEINDLNRDDPQGWVSKFLPGWNVIAVRDTHILVEEDPSLLSYTYINRADGMVYGRQSYRKGNSLDDDRLRKEDPELWWAISEWPEPQYSLINEAIQQLLWTTEEYRHEFLDRFFADQDIQRVLSSPDKWTDDQLKRVTKYFVPGEINVRLVKPRPATPEELEN